MECAFENAVTKANLIFFFLNVLTMLVRRHAVTAAAMAVAAARFLKQSQWFLSSTWYNIHVCDNNNRNA